MHNQRVRVLPTLIAAAVAGLALSVAIRAAEPSDHDHNHPAPASSAATTGAGPMEAMQKMRVMHEKWMAAKTPAERQALMAAHMQVMQDAMKTMQGMGHGTDQGGMPVGMSGGMMQQRMDMMTMMMQMMMDREGSMPIVDPKASTPK